jgi:apolipoprotein N-acyltransferase
MNRRRLFQQPVTRCHFAALLLGSILPFAFSPFCLYPIALFVPGFLARIWYRLTAKQACFNGLIFGMGFFSTGVSWIYITLQQYGGMAVWLAALLTVMFILLLSLFFAFQAFFSQLLAKKTLTYFLMLFPAVWVSFEWLRSVLFSGFPWLLLGYSQTTSLLGNIAPLFGVYGVSLFTLWASSAVILIIFSEKRMYKIISGAMLMMILSISIFSFFSSWIKQSNKQIQVSLIQGNIKQSIKWSRARLHQHLLRYYHLTQSHWDSKLIIWPETAIPTIQENIQPDLASLNKLAQHHHSVILTGIPIIKKEQDSIQYYNGIITIGQQRVQTYLKEHLVPFGEYLPLHPLFSWFLQAVDIPMLDQTPGSKNQPLLYVQGIKIASFICYEIAYPILVLNRSLDANIILVLTDDSWFGESAAPAQHLQIAQMRARELGRYVLFSTNNGITAIIHPNGSLKTVLPTRTVATLTASVMPIKGQTPLMRWNYYPVIVMVLILFLLNFWL